MITYIPNYPYDIKSTDAALVYYLGYVKDDLAKIEILCDRGEHFEIRIIDTVSEPGAQFGEFLCPKDWLIKRDIDVEEYVIDVEESINQVYSFSVSKSKAINCQRQAEQRIVELIEKHGLPKAIKESKHKKVVTKRYLYCNKRVIEG